MKTSDLSVVKTQMLNYEKKKKKDTFTFQRINTIGLVFRKDDLPLSSGNRKVKSLWEGS